MITPGAYPQRVWRLGTITRAVLCALAGAVVLCAALAGVPASARAATYDQEINLSTCTQNLTISAGGTYRLYGTTQWGVVVSTADAVYITLDNASIGSDTVKQPAITCGGNTTLYLTGTNTLVCGGGAGTDNWTDSVCLLVGSGGHLTIDLAPDSASGGGALAVHNYRAVGGGGIGGSGVSNVTINGGTVEAYGAKGGGGIGCFGFADTQHGTITIDGGHVTSYGSPYGRSGADDYRANAAIASWAYGPVIINGGTVNAYGGDGGPGILCSVTVNGGNVTAQGGFGAAGIGAPRYSYASGSVIISGGTVTAMGGQYGAGIGGGEENCLGGGGEGGEVQITGGTVFAVGNENGAGIGGGKGGQAGPTYISGGWVFARAGAKAAGIGGGYAGNTTKGGAAITITGGTVTAYGTQGGAGIGGGCENAVGTGGEGGPVIITGGSVKALGDGTAGGQAIGHGAGDSYSGTLTNGLGDTVTLTKRAGIFDAVSPVSVNLIQHISTVHASYDYRYSGIGHSGDTSIYVYLPVGVAFQPVTALLGSLKTEPPAAGLSPRLRSWLVDKLQAAKSAYEHKRYRETVALLGAVRAKVVAESGKGIPADKATGWIYIIDLIIKHVETR